MGRHLGIDFSWIFVDFGSQVGAKLGSKIDKKSIQKSIEKLMARRRRLGSVLERLGGLLEPFWSSKIHRNHRCRAVRGAVAEVQRPLQEEFRKD